MKTGVLNEEIDEPPPLQESSDSSRSAVVKTVSSLSPLTHISKHLKVQKSKNILFDNSIKKTSRKFIIPKSSLNFINSPRAIEFRKRYYPEATGEQWNDWRWQLRNRIKDLRSLEKILYLSDAERSAISSHYGPLPSSISPYYASLIDPMNAEQPLRRTVVMVANENEISPFEAIDPLNEDKDSPVPGLVHRYPDRVLFLVTGFCAVYCRYCTRSRMVGNQGGEYRFNIDQWENALDYIKTHPEIRDVLLSGGDPLTLADEKIEWLLSRLHRIPHVEFVRIGTKVPVVLPQRITRGLLNILRRFHPLWLSIHFTHPDEITPEVAQACGRLADAGIPLGNQTVLLKGVNDNVETMKRLVHGLLKIRVKPYYLYQCDPVAGTSHFRTSVNKGLEILEGLRGHTTGYAVPTFVVDAPGGGGKIPLLPNSVAGRDGDYLLLRNYTGTIYPYPDPVSETALPSNNNGINPGRHEA